MKWLTLPLVALLLTGCGMRDALVGAMDGARPTPSASAGGRGVCVINVTLAPDLYEAYIRNVNPEAEELRKSLKLMQDATGVYCTVNAGQSGQFDSRRISVSLTYRVVE